MAMFINIAFIGTAFMEILPAVPMTLMITALTILVGTVAAVLLAYARFYRLPVLSPLAKFYVSFFRGTPIVMHFFLVYYGLSQLLDFVAASFGWSFRASDVPLSVLAVLALSFSASAFFAEILRAGIAAVHTGEIEAAYSLGMTHWQTMRRIILPQAFTLSLPNWGSRCIAILQGSSLAFWISVVEVTAKANLVAASTYQYMEAFIAAAAVYWILSFSMERVLRFFEVWKSKHLDRGLARVS